MSSSRKKIAVNGWEFVTTFAPIPEWVVEEFDPYAILVYISLRMHLNMRTGRCDPSIRSIAKRVGISESSARRGLQALKDGDVVASVPRFNDAGKQISSQYAIRFDHPCLIDSFIGVSDRQGQSEGQGVPVCGTDELDEGELEGEVNLPLDDVLDLPVRENGTVARTSAGAREAERLCLQLADAVRDNGCRRPTINKDWLDSARLLVDKDGVSPDEVSAAIQWATSHAFWRANIMSMPKLREKFDTLRMQARRERESGKGRSDAVKQGLMEMAGER